MTNWIDLLAYFLAGAFLANAVPHLVSGMTGRAFQSPFAKPPGKGLSSSIVNVLWGAFNVVVGYVFLLRVGTFDLRCTSHALTVGSGALLLAVLTAHIFGPFHGGNSPLRNQSSEVP